MYTARGGELGGLLGEGALTIEAHHDKEDACDDSCGNVTPKE